MWLPVEVSQSCILMQPSECCRCANRVHDRHVTGWDSSNFLRHALDENHSIPGFLPDC
jgi:hypothetical protein